MLTRDLFSSYLQDAGVSINGHQPFDIRINDDRMFKQLKFNPPLAAGESYMKGQWDCERLDELFYKICRNNLDSKLYDKWHVRLFGLVSAFINLQSYARSKEVAEKHYNLGNDFYRDMLGQSMAYTCAYWKNAKDLDQAQYNKFDLVCRKINLQPTDRVLELGCGWGSMAKYMAENYGCSVVAVNISTEQVRYARQICNDMAVEVCLADYREDQIYNPSKIPFNKIVSVGLCEHIGHRNYREFIEIVRRNITDDGLFLLHTIGKNDSTNYVDPWINKYIFPNGILPSIKLLGGSFENLFVLEDLHNFGSDYDKTLMAWHANFIQNWDKNKVDHDHAFYRLWNYYLLSCAGAFRARAMQLWQMVLSPKGILGGYTSIR